MVTVGVHSLISMAKGEGRVRSRPHRGNGAMLSPRKALRPSTFSRNRVLLCFNPNRISM